MATILTKKKDTTGAPVAGDLTNSAGGAELAVNTFDKRLYSKDSGGNVVEIGINPTSVTTGALTATGTTTLATSLTGIAKLASGVVSAATAGTDYPGLATAQTFTKGQRGAIVTLTDGATVTPDMADGNNFSLTLGGNRTLANPTNLTAGQSGSIFLVQDGTGSRTLAYGSYYDFAGGTAPTLTTTASAVDRIDYIVRSTTSIHCVFTANYS